jgi:hypothetical protein
MTSPWGLGLAFVGASDKESVATIKHLEAKFGYGWVDEWLAGQGIEPSMTMEAA